MKIVTRKEVIHIANQILETAEKERAEVYMEEENRGINKEGYTIGEGCIVGGYVHFHDGCSVGRYITIEDGVTIFSGVRVGDYAVIREGSIVIYDVLPGMIVWGNPAEERDTILHRRFIPTLGIKVPSYQRFYEEFASRECIDPSFDNARGVLEYMRHRFLSRRERDSVE